jgi:hypothetical protein
MESAQDIDPLTAVVRALKPLDSADRRRTVDAAMHYLGETPLVKSEQSANAAPGQPPASANGYPSATAAWLKQNSVTEDELDQVFHFGADGTFEIHDVPGESKKQKTLNTYILTGLGRYLATGQREFDDTLARRFCQTIGCYDPGNHSKYLGDYKGPEFAGDKSKGYVLANPGAKRGAALVKELAGAAK